MGYGRRCSLVPNDRRTTVRCIVGSCLAVLAGFGIVHMASYLAMMWR